MWECQAWLSSLTYTCRSAIAVGSLIRFWDRAPLTVKRSVGRVVIPCGPPTCHGFCYGSESAIYAIGFAAKPPAARAARAGRHNDRALPRNAPVLVLWVDAFWVYRGDKLTLTITGPDGERFHRYSNEIKANKARQFLFSGRKKKSLFWPAGEYRGEAVLIRKRADGKTVTLVARQTVTLK